MALSPSLSNVVEYRGVEGLVAAEVLVDDGTEYTTGPVYAIAGVAEISRTVDSTDEAHYYDNLPMVVISSTSADTVTISASAIPLEVLAFITGQTYDSNKGAYIEGVRTSKYFALGYKTKKTDGSEVYIWRYKGKFNQPGETNATENDGTDANGQEIVYTGIATTHKFSAAGNKGAKSMYVDVAADKADVSNFFTTVTTPDTLVGKTKYTLTISGTATDLHIMRGSDELETGADIYSGDELKISWTGTHTVTVGGNSWVSGDIKVVSGNLTVSIS